MARTVASLPAGSRITDYISLGVVAKFFPAENASATGLLQNLMDLGLYGLAGITAML